ncbi:hypothetical protein EDC04DRAFT_2602731 [Pisolithus marmoratus]|nr:hypothetical protein EDC04DRAFT_2602731 [Pisolithus marmoratus]
MKNMSFVFHHLKKVHGQCQETQIVISPGGVQSDTVMSHKGQQTDSETSCEVGTFVFIIAKAYLLSVPAPLLQQVTNTLPDKAEPGWKMVTSGRHASWSAIYILLTSIVWLLMALRIEGNVVQFWGVLHEVPSRYSILISVENFVMVMGRNTPSVVCGDNVKQEPSPYVHWSIFDTVTMPLYCAIKTTPLIYLKAFSVQILVSLTPSQTYKFYDLIKADPYCAQCSNGLSHIPLSQVPDIAHKLLQKHTNLDSIAGHQQYHLLDFGVGTDNLFNTSQILQLILHSFSLSASIPSHCLESEGCDDVSTCWVPINGHSPLERCLKDICQKISEVNEMQEQLVDDKHVIAAKVEGMRHMIKSVDKMLGDHEGQLSALDNTQRRVVEEFNNLEMHLASVQKNHACKDASLKDIQASLANLEANLTMCRHDLKQQLRNKSNALHQCITNSLTGLQSSQLSLDEQLTILENKANGIQNAQEKHTMLFSQALAGIHSLSEGFMMLLDHTQDIDIIQVALCDMQETMDSVKTTLEQISGDGSSDMTQSWACPQLSLEEELCHSTHGFPTLLRVVDDSKEMSPEGPPQCGASSAAPSSNAGKNLCRWTAAQLYRYSMAIICSVVPVFSRQPAMVFLVFICFFSTLRGGPLKTQEEVDQPLWYALRYGGLPSIAR